MASPKTLIGQNDNILLIYGQMQDISELAEGSMLLEELRALDADMATRLEAERN